mgnify:CR=1 FL=1
MKNEKYLTGTALFVKDANNSTFGEAKQQLESLSSKIDIVYLDFTVENAELPLLDNVVRIAYHCQV